MTACVASWYASSWLTSLNATRTSRPRSCCVYQCGRGYDPTIVVGSSVSTIFLRISSSSSLSGGGAQLRPLRQHSSPRQQVVPGRVEVCEDAREVLAEQPAVALDG